MNIKKKIRSSAWGLFLIHSYHAICCKISRLFFSDYFAVIRYYRKVSGKQPNLASPTTFSEKLQWLKLNAKNPLKAQCADKYNVREYVSSCGYASLLNELYGVWDSVNDINIEKLPEQFVLKGAHGSGFNLIVKNKQDVNWFAWKWIMRTWLWQDIYWSGREWVYKDLPKRIIAEKYLEDSYGELRDYKFFCFNGKPTFMQLEVGRNTKQNTRNFYDLEWNLLPFGKELPHNPDIQVEKPAKFDEMIKIATDLSSPFDFVRVDLYQVYDRVFFGELTFFPAGGAPDFVPSEYDSIVGKMLELQ
ncbi:MAG: ATP-grasp fold amidoligase family protein [Akkermansia sp.]|nr:ATP-grasp fold amidoligase family protein [Akkermansia sp.]